MDMAKFIVRRLLLMLLTMFLVSVAVFAITTAAPGNVARNVLGIQITKEQEASFLAQNGLDKPAYARYLYWLFGTDWRASGKVGLPVKEITTPDGFKEWWAVGEDGKLVRWKLEGENLIASQRQPDGTQVESVDNGRWQVKDPGTEVARLEEYRTKLMSNSQLTESDRQAILQPLDQIIKILQEAVKTGQNQSALLASISQPEAALEALQDPEAAKVKQALQKTGTNLLGKDSLIQAISIYQVLSSPDASLLKSSDLQFMAGQLNRAAVKMRDLDPGLAGNLQKVYESLKAGDVNAAKESLASVAPRLNQLTSNFALFSDGLENGDYQQAAKVLSDLSDPAKIPFDTAQMAVLPETLQLAGSGLEDADPQLSEAFNQAVASLKADDPQAARTAFGKAAILLAGLGQVIARNDAAGSAKVGRVFWGIDNQNHAVRWETGSGKEVWVFIQGTGWKAFSGGPTEYIPLQRGLLRADPGISLRTGRPVSDLLFIRFRNSLVLAGLAFIIVMPLALVLGIIAGLKEGKASDRVLSIGGMMFSVAPEFATGIFLILIFAFWLKLVPGATVFGEKAPWTRPDMLVLPVMTLTLIELGYVMRITRASMVEVMRAPYIRTAFLKGLPYRQVVMKHAVRNALMAPITVIMLHVNWLLGGIVVVEVIFGYPGLGSYLLDSALFKDFNAIEAGAMILVLVAVTTQLIADIIYTFINPRIRYA
jgi:ABC-type dipeptide/oligopeptide/nickel transport system permease component